ncbi:MAG: hypothetical protein QM820_62275 [Minicystis sp.]
MHSGLIGNAILHSLSLAVVYGGQAFAKASLKKAVLQGVSSDRERGKVLEIAWSEFNKIQVPAHLVFTGTWLIERSAIKRFSGDKRTMRLIGVKDALIGGALATGVANVVAGRMMKRDFPDGVPYPSEGNVTPAQAAKIARYIGFFRVVGTANHLLVGASIATSTLIGASILRNKSRGLLAKLLNR